MNSTLAEGASGVVDGNVRRSVSANAAPIGLGPPNMNAGARLPSALDENRGRVTDAFTVTVGNPTSTENPWLSNLEIYPNPVESELIVEGDLRSITRAAVVNATGQDVSHMIRLIQSSDNKLILDVFNLPPGMYQLVLDSQGIPFVRK